MPFLSRKMGRRIGVSAFIFYIFLVFLFETLLGLGQPEYGSTMTLTSFDENGEAINRVVARLERDGEIYVAVNHWPRAWARRIEDNPNVQLSYLGETEDYSAVLLDGSQHDRANIDFSVPFSFKVLTGFPPRYFFRFDPLDNSESVSAIQLTPSVDCQSNSDIDFICGLINPEDLYRVPESDWVIASGRISDSEGPIYAVNVLTYQAQEIFPDNALASNFDQQTYRDCPGPNTVFQPHGLTIREGAEDTHDLYVVGHGAREAIEVFNLDVSNGVPALSWKGCIPAPEGTRRINSITALPNGFLGATNFDTSGGELWEWHPSTNWLEVAGSEMLGPNGLVSSIDGEWYYIGGWSDRALVRLSRGKDPVVMDYISVGFNVDNVRWGEDGRIIAAGHITRCPDQNPCELSAVRVAKVNPNNFNIDQLIDYKGNDFFELGTVAIDVADEIWVGGIYGSYGIARFPQ